MPLPIKQWGTTNGRFENENIDEGDAMDSRRHLQTQENMVENINADMTDDDFDQIAHAVCTLAKH